MANSFAPLTEGLTPRHLDHGIPVPSFPQNYDPNLGHTDPRYFPYHHAFAPSAHQQSPSSGRRSYFQEPPYHHAYPVGGVPTASYMENPSALLHHATPGSTMWQPLPIQPQLDPAMFTRFDEGDSVDEVLHTRFGSGHSNPAFGLPGYPDPSNDPSPQWPHQAPRNFRNFTRHPHPPTPPLNSLQTDLPEAETISDEIMSFPSLQTEEMLHHDAMMRRNVPYQRPYRQVGFDLEGQARRHFLRVSDDTAFLHEFGSSPRSSSRWSSDRYSTDLPGGTPVSNGPSRSTSRAADRTARRQRVVGHLSYRRMSGHIEHPNVPSFEQLRALRAKLRHLLPGELPEGNDAICDICQKEYSDKHVEPSEDNEVAIQLPCKHVFGEQCINTWFETCKKHKNKITCPMCRQLLIEPRSREHAPSRAQLMERLQRARRQGEDRMILQGVPRTTAEERAVGEPSTA